MVWGGLALLVAMAGGVCGEEPRTRLVVLTDITSLTAGEAEPDDGQSLVRLLLYANEFDVEGLIATSNLGHGERCRPDLIAQAVDAYARVLPNLRKHDPGYPAAEALRNQIRAGWPKAGPKVAVDECVGAGKGTEASRWIVEVVDRPDPRPVWVVVWGGTADLAQALRDVRASRSADEVARFVSRLRVHAIADQDATGPWIRERFPELFVIRQQRAFRGMYRGGDTRLAASDWVQTHIKGHGALGDLYPDYRGGDIFGRTLGPVRGIKEGDTPSFLALVPNGLLDPERPEIGGWGGRFAPEAAGRPRHLVDIPDPDGGDAGDPDPRMKTVHRWRPDFQADFAARLDWCVRPVGEANHPPVVRVAGDRERTTAPGQTVELDARESSDPDGDRLSFRWSIEPADTELRGAVRIEDAEGPRARLVVMRPLSARTVPVLLTVRDDGEPGLARYARVLVMLPGAAEEGERDGSASPVRR